MAEQPNGRHGPWFLSSRGEQLWPLDMRASDIHIEDIAHSLSLLCRFNGHCRDFYSVAQHSVLVSDVVPEEFALCGLMHDATEAYCGDLVRPIKKAIPMFEVLERDIWAAIAARFELPLDLPDAVKAADCRMLQTERRDLLVAHSWPWTFEQIANGEVDPYPFRVEPWSPQEAADRFLASYAVFGATVRYRDEGATG